MQEAIDELVRLAVQQLGGHQGAAGAARIAAYRQARGASSQGSWNSAFFAWLLRQWLATPAAQAGLPGLQACTAAHAFDWPPWAKQQGLLCLPPSQQALRGDLLLYDFPQLGLLLEDQLYPAASLQTLEADCLDGAGMAGVWRRERAPHLLRGLIRLRR